MQQALSQVLLFSSRPPYPLQVKSVAPTTISRQYQAPLARLANTCQLLISQSFPILLVLPFLIFKIPSILLLVLELRFLLNLTASKAKPWKAAAPLTTPRPLASRLPRIALHSPQVRPLPFSSVISHPFAALFVFHPVSSCPSLPFPFHRFVRSLQYQNSGVNGGVLARLESDSFDSLATQSCCHSEPSHTSELVRLLCVKRCLS